jgi:hypothetical protein
MAVDPPEIMVNFMKMMKEDQQKKFLRVRCSQYGHSHL